MYYLKRLVRTVSMRHSAISLIFLIVGTLILSGCAYFNTFYNAQNYFRTAEEEIAKKTTGEELSKQAEEALDKTIVNCNIVLEDFPESKLRDDALFLSAKSYYYRGEFSTAKKRLLRLKREHPASPFLEEAYLWLSRCKWKLGETEAAQNDLQALSESLDKERGNRVQHVQVAITLGEIYIELGDRSEAVVQLRKAVNLSKDSILKGQLLLRSGELLLQINQPEKALATYQEVLKVSSESDHLNTANLEVVRILRLLERWDETIKTIQLLLSDDKFSSLQSDLNLELAQLYEMRGMVLEAKSRFSIITDDFPKTEASASAYYHLGGLALFESEDYEAAKRYFGNVEKEKRSSLLVPASRIRIKEIESYLEVISELDILKAVLVAARVDPSENETLKSESEDSSEFMSDTLSISAEENETAAVDTMNTRQELSQYLYALGELLAFHFNRVDSAINVLEKLVMGYPESDARPQALFTLGYLLTERNDTVKAEIYLSDILETHPTTEYAVQVASERGIELINEAEELLESAEAQIKGDPESAIQSYKRILIEYPESQYVPFAILSIGYVHEYSLHDMDSTLSYYGKLVETYPESEQAESIQSHYNELSTAFNQSQTDTLRRQTESDSTLFEIETDSDVVKFNIDIAPSQLPIPVQIEEERNEED